MIPLHYQITLVRVIIVRNILVCVLMIPWCVRLPYCACLPRLPTLLVFAFWLVGRWGFGLGALHLAVGFAAARHGAWPAALPCAGLGAGLGVLCASARILGGLFAFSLGACGFFTLGPS